MPENEHHPSAEQIKQVAETLRANQRTLEIQTLAGPETLTVTWEKSLVVGSSEYYRVVAKDSRQQEVGNIDYAIELSKQPPSARVVHMFVELPYRGKDIAPQLLKLVAKDLEEKGIVQVESKIRKNNLPALASGQHVREMLTGHKYKTTYQPSADQPEFYDVVTYLDQLEDEQGET